jgi:hypothetical protein
MFNFNAVKPLLTESYLLPSAAEVQRVYDNVLDQVDDLDEALSETEILLNIEHLHVNGAGQVSAYRGR